MNIKFRDGDNVRTVLGKHILTDGFDIVVDLDKSNGPYLVDLNTGKKYLDCFPIIKSYRFERKQLTFH